MSQGKSITSNRASRVIGALLQNMDFGEVNNEIVDWVLNNPKDAGRRFTAFLASGLTIQEHSSLIQIDRTTPFNPEEFLGEGWTVEEEDERALKLTEIDLSQVTLEPVLEAGETSINGEKRLKRLKEAGKVRLDAKIFLTFWNNPHLIPESWKDYFLISFDGTELRSPNGYRAVLYLYWSNDQWHWVVDGLDNGFVADSPSAVLDPEKLAA